MNIISYHIDQYYRILIQHTLMIYDIIFTVSYDMIRNRHNVTVHRTLQSSRLLRKRRSTPVEADVVEILISLSSYQYSSEPNVALLYNRLTH